MTWKTTMFCLCEYCWHIYNIRMNFINCLVRLGIQLYVFYAKDLFYDIKLCWYEIFFNILKKCLKIRHHVFIRRFEMKDQQSPMVACKQALILNYNWLRSWLSQHWNNGSCKLVNSAVLHCFEHFWLLLYSYPICHKVVLYVYVCYMYSL